MKRTFLGVALLAATPLFSTALAQPAPAAPAAADAEADLVVARVNGETITRG
jgi:hypothetical protein